MCTAGDLRDHAAEPRMLLDAGGDGIGRQLTSAALAEVPGRTVLLEVAEGNESARHLYRGDGFVEISRRRGYYPDGENAVIMQRQAARETGNHE